MGQQRLTHAADREDTRSWHARARLGRRLSCGRGLATHSSSNAMCTGVGRPEHLSEQARGTTGEGATFVGWDLKAPRRRARARARVTLRQLPRAVSVSMSMIDYSWRWRRRRRRQSCQAQAMSHPIHRTLVLHLKCPRQWGSSPASDWRTRSACGLRLRAKTTRPTHTTRSVHVADAPLLRLRTSKRDATSVACKAGDDWRVASSIQELSRHH